LFPGSEAQAPNRADESPADCQRTILPFPLRATRARFRIREESLAASKPSHADATAVRYDSTLMPDLYPRLAKLTNEIKDLEAKAPALLLQLRARWAKRGHELPPPIEVLFQAWAEAQKGQASATKELRRVGAKGDAGVTLSAADLKKRPQVEAQIRRQYHLSRALEREIAFYEANPDLTPKRSAKKGQRG
jgi:hypothetical protein